MLCKTYYRLVQKSVSSLYNVFHTHRQVLIWRHERFVDGEWEVVEEVEIDEDIGLGVHPYGNEYCQNY